ncbi:Hsp70 family protein [Ascidiaceihabitans sp.]|uniref:Hsp70 family protein n=1 Tax=Ascidiaceihabitans sp. TaxID=1872644 RepID=UPI003296D878
MAHDWAGKTLGIDFGTSNSAAGVAVAGKPYLIPIEQGAPTLPTSVFFGVGASQMSMGSAANRALIAGEEGRYMRALKSVLGTSLMGEMRMFLGEKMNFYDIIGAFLSQVKSRAEAQCHQTFDYVLSGRPVRFHSADEDRNARAEADLVECYMRAGFKDLRFLVEPEAAALASGVPRGPGLSLIVDIGGGTSDFCVFRMADGIEVMANSGIRMGGTNFDKRLSLDHVMPLLGKGALIRNEMGKGAMATPNSLFQKLATWEQIPFLYAGDVKRDVAKMVRLAVEPKPMERLFEVLDMELGHEVAFAVEAGKIRSNEEDAQINLSIVEKGLGAPLTQTGMQASLAKEVADIKQGALDTLTMAGCMPEDIVRVVFVGGSSLLRPVQNALAEACPKAELDYRDAFTAVVDGLALGSADPMRFGRQPAA